VQLQGTDCPREISLKSLISKRRYALAPDLKREKELFFSYRFSVIGTAVFILLLLLSVYLR
jgi:hypothetical protein